MTRNAEVQGGRSRGRAPLRLAAVLGVVVVLLAPRADADPTPADKETARRLMTEGRGHRRDGDAKAALQSFLAADSIMHVPTTGLEVARTEADLGQLVEARDEVLAIARIPDPGNEPKAFREARETAKTLGAELESRIPSLVMKLSGAPEGAAVKVTVDGVAIPAAALTAPRAVNPGHHVVAATLPAGAGAAGAAQKAAEVDVKEGEAKEVSLDLAASVATSGPVTNAARSNDGPSPLRIASYVGFGVGGAGIIAGTVTGVLAISKLSAARQQGCVGNNCPPAASPDLSTANTMATVSTVAFIVGGVGVGGGVVAFLLSRRGAPSHSESPAATSPTVSVEVGPTWAGLSGSF